MDRIRNTAFMYKFLSSFSVYLSISLSDIVRIAGDLHQLPGAKDVDEGNYVTPSCTVLRGEIKEIRSRLPPWGWQNSPWISIKKITMQVRNNKQLTMFKSENTLI